MKSLGSIGSTRAGLAGFAVLRVGLAAVFIVAGVLKLRQSPEAFADSIASFRLVPSWAINPLAMGLPPFEVLAGAMLLTARPRRLGACCVLLLSAGFLLALTLALVRGTAVDCGCFGSGPSWLPMSGTQRLWFDAARDAVLTIGALILYLRDAAAASQEQRTSK